MKGGALFMNDELNGDVKNKDIGESGKTGKGGLAKLAGDIYDVVELFIFCTIAIVLIFTFVARMAVVSGNSMEHTLQNGDYLLVTDMFYEPEQGDIVVAQNISLSGDYCKPIVKRIIATENQVIDINFSTWTVTVDGVVVDEPYIYLDKNYFITSDIKYPYTVPEGHVFVMGDNRYHSADSRFREVGVIDTRCIVGKMVVRAFPLSSIGDPDAKYYDGK